MLRVVCSPAPGLRWQPESLPAELAALSRRLDETPRACAWIVPTSRRRRALLRQAVPGSQAMLLPRIHTLESLVAQALEYSPRAGQRVTGPERLLRLARAWTEVGGGAAQPPLIRQLDRFVRDWQACRLSADAAPDLFSKVVQRFQAEMAADQRLDRMSSFALLIDELQDSHSWPRRSFFSTMETMIFDGFHRLEPIELDLVGVLSRQCHVLLWLLARRGQITERMAAAAVTHLTEAGFEPTTQWHDPPSPSAFAEIGRRLFPADRQSAHAIERAAGAESPAIFQLEERCPREEIEAVARAIKRDFRRARERDDSMRLSDVAVIIPGPGYDALLREVFPRAGLEFNLAGRALEIGQSRPARVLTAALELIRNHWRHDLLLDFLNLPLVHRRLADRHLLHELFEQRPRSRKRLDASGWRASWEAQLALSRRDIDDWTAGKALPDGVRQSRQEFIDSKTRRAEGLARLTAAMDIILQPVSAIEQLFARPPAKGALRELVKRIGDLFRILEIESWLRPPSLVKSMAFRPVPWVEYEKDQQAYFKLLNVLHALAATPDARLPLHPDGRPDLRLALTLALDSESYQIKTEDDAGVQIFELREIRGMRFRHVYVLGLVDGVLPVLPEEGVLVARRRRVPALANQLLLKEEETACLFTQVFESASEKLVLSRWTREGDRPSAPSPYLLRVQQDPRIRPLPPLPPARLAPSIAEVAARFGAHCVGVESIQASRLWPTATGDAMLALDRIANAVAEWRSRPAAAGVIDIRLPALLARLYPSDRPFSPSELEQYAACPFRYFGARVLKLAEREVDESHMAHGSLLHRVLNQFYQERRAANRQPPPLGPADRERLLQIHRQQWDNEVEGMLSPELLTIFEKPNGLLDFFLELMAQIEADGGNLHTELQLQAPLGRDAMGREVTLKGVIDRVDSLKHGAGGARVIDYKTGAIMKHKELAAKLGDGRRLQLPLYAAAYEVHEPARKVTRGLYVHLTARKRSSEKSWADAIISIGPLQCARGVNGGKSVKGPDNGAIDTFDTQSAVDMALAFASRIRAGDFRLTDFPRGSDLCECHTRCPLRHACRHPEGYEVSPWR